MIIQGKFEDFYKKLNLNKISKKKIKEISRKHREQFLDTFT